MAEEKSPLFQIATGEYTTDTAGQKPSYSRFRLRWDSEERKGPDGKTFFVKTLMHEQYYPGSNDQLDRKLREYDEDGKTVTWRDEALEMVGTGRENVSSIADQFEKNAGSIETGTPLGVLNLDPAQISTLKSKNVWTVEGLRDVPDIVLPDLGRGGRALRQRAIDFVENKDRNADISKLSTENEQLKEAQKASDEELAELRKEMAELRKMVDTKRKGA